jgi:hypothetical protein
MITKRILFLFAWLGGVGIGLGFDFPQTLCSGFVEENTMNIPVGAAAGGLTETDFNSVLNAVEAVYAPIASAKGGTLQIRRLWNDGTVNASAMRYGSTWVVNMYGGLARHPAITSEGFALVACHEVGHHIGGTPKVSDGWFNSWASNEGQSDYFAVLKCLRRVFTPAENLAWVQSSNLDPYLLAECASQFQSPEEQALCARASMGGMSTAELFRDLRKETTPALFNTPDQKVVAATDDAHPGTQCRLDTYFQGSICTADLNAELNDRDYRQGTCTVSSGFQKGQRPLCWFKP